MTAPSLEALRHILSGEAPDLPSPAALLRMIEAWRQDVHHVGENDRVATDLRAALARVERAWVAGTIAGTTVGSEGPLEGLDLRQQMDADIQAYSRQFSMQRWFAAGWMAGWNDTP